MVSSLKKLIAHFYKLDSGKEPVREWLLDLDREDRRDVGIAIMKVELGWPIGLPYCRPLGSGLYEVRRDISHGRIARVMFCIEKNQMVLLHGFVKKTQTTPDKDIKLARKRMKGNNNG